ncbi:uncharacterized protein LOC121598484 [Anopheles merus]|uniref:uncharacterized protein LOC121598484 n=1 Tax=Anopheles merus TaxID=30066 RepID=UPI001BE4A82C|nr:uncharacterized protein LOC121598484 [Anopheles merus]XP_041781345.1 uncharacterized protein LOC121598484 [Anopheles merus]XP_041781346.1 uncharacterized protein LOC121598484 [Anopheles merus]
MALCNPFSVATGEYKNSQPYCPGEPLFPAYSHAADSSTNSSNNNYNSNVGGLSDFSYNSITTTPTDASISTTAISAASTPLYEAGSARRKLFKKTPKPQQLSKLATVLKPYSSGLALHNVLSPAMPEITVAKQRDLEFKAEIVVNATRYEAVGQNKKIAKANVSEMVLRDLCLQHLSAQGDEEQQLDEVEPNSYEALLMTNVASFAVHKLLEEWNASLLAVNWQPTISSPSADGIKIRSQLPPNPTSYVPTSLLVFMVPQVKFENDGETILGSTDQKIYKARARVDGQCFFGTGSSKKLARMAAAQDACKTLFGVEY